MRLFFLNVGGRFRQIRTPEVSVTAILIHRMPNSSCR